MTREQAENILSRISVFSAEAASRKQVRKTEGKKSYKCLKTEAIFKTSSVFSDVGIPANKTDGVPLTEKKSTLPVAVFHSFRTVEQEKKFTDSHTYEWPSRDIPEREDELYGESNAGRFYAQLTGRFMGVNVSESLYAKLREKLTGLKTAAQIRKMREKKLEAQQYKKSSQADYADYEQEDEKRRHKIKLIQIIAGIVLGVIAGLFYLIGSCNENCSSQSASGAPRAETFVYSGTEEVTVRANAYTDTVSFPSLVSGGFVVAIGAPVSTDGNAKLKKAIIPDGVRTIGNEAFYACSRLSDITLPSGLRTIEQYAFGKCTALTSITLPKGVRTVAHFAFYDCTALTQVKVMGTQTELTNLSFQGCSGITDLTAPAEIVYCFPRRNLRTVTMTAGKRIDISLFKECAALEYAEMSDDILYICDNAFYLCTALRKLTLSQNVISIGKSAFSGCGELTEIRLPRTLESIGAYAFAGCGNLQIEFAGTAQEWESVQKGEDWDIGLRSKPYTIRCSDEVITV